MLAKATGANRQVSPRDTTVRKHFYSIDVDEGRDPAVEAVLEKIETVAAPIIGRLLGGSFPVGTERLELALFVAMCWLRTPVWRDQTASILEQATAAMVEMSYRLDPDAAQRALADAEMSPEEIEEARERFVDDLRSGRLTIEMPKNYMIKQFLDSATSVSWLLFMLDWSLVRLEDGTRPQFVIGDTPVSIFDPTPVFPGGGSGVLSSPNAQTFLPLAPDTGLLLQASERVWNWMRENGEAFREMTDKERVDQIGDREGGWGQDTAIPSFALDLNLRTYAHADRFVFGHQRDLQEMRTARRRFGARLAEVAPRGPRLHLVEDDATSPTGLRIADTFAPKPR